MPGTPLRRPLNCASTVIHEEKPHKKLIKRTLSYRQIRRHQSDSAKDPATVKRNLQSLKGLSNSAKVLNSDSFTYPRKAGNKFNTMRIKTNVSKNKRPMSLDLDSVARVLNAEWSDDFKISLFKPDSTNLSAEVGAKDHFNTLPKKYGVDSFRKSLRRKDIRQKLSRHSAPLSIDNIKTPSFGGYLKDSWDTFLIKMTDKQPSDMRK